VKQAWSQFEHHIWNEIKKYSLEKSKIIVAFSGGADSMALVHALKNILGPSRIAVAHFHHGQHQPHQNGVDSTAREKALEFCRDWAQQNKVEFFSEIWQGAALKSEAQWREKRYEFLLDLQKELTGGAEKLNSVVATAHHLDDVLETRMIRLIRGTGPQGLKAIEVFRKPFFRPLLAVSKKQIRVFINKQNLKFVTDPSNSDNHYLRNWLRNEWFVQLEEKRPGSKEVLGRSLEALVQSLPAENSAEPKDRIPRSEFLAQTEAQQTRWLARALLHTGRKDFTQFHLQEIRRRLLQSPKSNSFSVAGCEWLINAQQIRVQRA
jgi:tRNA(Ile)-lysidine synthase